MPRLMTLLMLTACGNKPDNLGDSDSAAVDGALEEVRLAAEGAMSGYLDWTPLAGWEGVVASEDGTHGPFVQIWLNDAARAVIEAQVGGDMPAGATLVKRGYDNADGTGLRNLTVMYKDAEYGWYWASWDPAGEPLLSGQPDGCTACHASGQDGVRFTTW